MHLKKRIKNKSVLKKRKVEWQDDNYMKDGKENEKEKLWRWENITLEERYRQDKKEMEKKDFEKERSRGLGEKRGWSAGMELSSPLPCWALEQAGWSSGTMSSCLVLMPISWTGTECSQSSTEPELHPYFHLCQKEDGEQLLRGATPKEEKWQTAVKWKGIFMSLKDTSMTKHR